jgi:acetamidase/formamidase
MKTCKPDSSTVHSGFSSQFSPVLKVDSNEIFEVETPDVAFGLAQHPRHGEPRQKVSPSPGRQGEGPACVGPIWVNDAKPGHFLKIVIEAAETASWGWTVAGPNGQNNSWIEALELVKEPTLIRWQLNKVSRTATAEHAWQVPMTPFPGTLGVCPTGSGMHSGWAPGIHGGNLDCRLLTAGSALIVPVFHEGALVSVGDGHAAQGNGEVAGSAIETPMRIRLRCTVFESFPVNSPIILMEDAKAFLGFGSTLDQAARFAIRAAVKFETSQSGITEDEALALASVACDLQVTQVANGIVGAHAIWKASKQG